MTTTDIAWLRELLDQAQMRDEYGPSIPTQERWRQQGTGPKYIKLGGRVRYRRSDIEEWLDSRTVDTTAS
jgi:predicted DNA-binding transcriptional regulator AlpA